MIWAALTGEGKPGAVTDPRQAVAWTYGRNQRGNPDAAAAAADLGVSTATVRRWIRADPDQRSAPSRRNAAAVKGMLGRATRRRNASPTFRQSLIDQRAQKMKLHGATLKFSGVIKISGDVRHRTIEAQELTAQQAAKLENAWVDGEAETVEKGFQDIINDNYFMNTDMASVLSVGKLEFEPKKRG